MAGLTPAEQLERLYALYKPGVQRGNFQADVRQRGANDLLARVIAKLELASPDEVAAEFKRRDDESWARTEAALERANAGR